MSRRFKILLLFFLASVIFLFVFYRENHVDIEDYAERVYQVCSDSKEIEKCYDKELSDLMDKVSMEEVFEVTRIVQMRDKNYPYCHVLGHKLAAIETKKDPTKWKEVISRCPAGVCSNGCVHGAFQEKYRMDVDSFTDFDVIVSELADVCKGRVGWSPSGLEQASCFHALGHLLMYVSKADILLATKTCDKIAKDAEFDYTSVCYDGAFMQIYQPLEQEDRELIVGKEITRDNVESFCKDFRDIKKESCVIESWPLYIKEITSPKSVGVLCDQLNGDSRENCYRDVFYIIPIQFHFDWKLMVSYCGGFDVGRQEVCALTMASRIMEMNYESYDKAVEFCEKFEENVSTSCLKGLVSYANFSLVNRSEIYDNFCKLMLAKHGLVCEDSFKKL